MVIGVVLAGTIAGKIAEQTILKKRRRKKMSKMVIRVITSLIKARINMIQTDMKMLQARKAMAMQAMRKMESVRSKIPTKFRKVVSQEIRNIKSNVSAVEALMNSLRREKAFLRSRVKAMRKMMRK